MKQLEGDLLRDFYRATMRLNGRRFCVGAMLRSATIWINEDRKVVFLFSHRSMAERFEGELGEVALGLQIALVDALGMINGWTISVAPRGKDNVLESSGSLKATRTGELNCVVPLPRQPKAESLNAPSAPSSLYVPHVQGEEVHGRDEVCLNEGITYAKACAACRKVNEVGLERWVKANGGNKGLQRRSEQANAFALERRKQVKGRLTDFDISQAYLRQWGFCGDIQDAFAFCDGLPEYGWEIDHVRPLSRGGENDGANIQLLCRSCNSDKGNKTNFEWKENLPARYDEWGECDECGATIKACFKMCYSCRFQDDR